MTSSPGFFTEMRLRPGTAVVQADDAVIIRHLWGDVTIQEISPGARNALLALADGWLTDEELCGSVAGEGEPSEALQAIAEVSWLLDQCPYLVCRRVGAALTPWFTVEPIAASAVLRPCAIDPDARLQLSVRAFVQQRKGHLVVESPASAFRLTVEHPHAWSVIGCLGRGETLTSVLSTISEAERGVALALLEFLAVCGMLAGWETPEQVGLSDELINLAEFHDLLFHQRSRAGLYDSRTGATFDFLGLLPPLPAVAAPASDSVVSLPTPTVDMRSRDLSLGFALENRSSTRRFGSQPMTLQDLSEFLFRTARIKATYGPIPEAGMPYEASERPYPSGGAAYELEVYLAVGRVAGLRRGIYRYAADKHALEALPDSDQGLDRLLQSAMVATATDRPPDVAITLAARFGRLAWKYRAISYATTLKNVGALFQTMYLVATAMRIAACAIGSGDSLLADRTFGLGPRSEIPVGEFMIGSLPAEFQNGAHPRRSWRSHPSWSPGVAPDGV